MSNVSLYSEPMKKQKREEKISLISGDQLGKATHQIEQKINYPLGGEYIETKLYKKRWWILFVYFFVSLVQGILWNTWAPLTDAAVVAFKWSDAQVTAIPAVSNLAFIILAFPTLYIIETTGIRISFIASVISLALGAVAWTVGVKTDVYCLAIVGAAFVGISACAPLISPSYISVTWFPVEERNTATGIAAMGTYLGVGLAFVTGPHISGEHVTTADVEHKHNHTQEKLLQLTVGIQRVMYFDTALAAACLFLVLVYFPNKPHKPPNQSQVTERMGYWEGIKYLVRSPQFWLLNLAFNCSGGFFNAWLPLASINLRPVGIDQATAGWVGFSAMVAAGAGAILISRVADCFNRKLRIITLISTSLAVVIIAILACLLQGYIVPPSMKYAVVVIFLLYIGACICVNGVIPLYYEIGSEITYPAHEAVAGTFLQVISFVFGAIYFLLFFNSTLSRCTEWMTWTLLGTTSVTFILLLFVKDYYPRLDVEYFNKQEK